MGWRDSSKWFNHLCRSMVMSGHVLLERDLWREIFQGGHVFSSIIFVIPSIYALNRRLQRLPERLNPPYVSSIDSLRGLNPSAHCFSHVKSCLGLITAPKTSKYSSHLRVCSGKLLSIETNHLLKGLRCPLIVVPKLRKR